MFTGLRSVGNLTTQMPLGLLLHSLWLIASAVYRKAMISYCDVYLHTWLVGTNHSLYAMIDQRWYLTWQHVSPQHLVNKLIRSQSEKMDTTVTDCPISIRLQLRFSIIAYLRNAPISNFLGGICVGQMFGSGRLLPMIPNGRLATATRQKTKKKVWHKTPHKTPLELLNCTDKEDIYL